MTTANSRTSTRGDDYDLERFNDGYCSEIGDEEYDPLVDWNCDGRIDCLDREQIIANWGTEGSIGGLVSATCEGMSDCD